MPRILAAALLTLCLAGAASSAQAVSFALDLPVQYTFADQEVNKKGGAKLTDKQTSNVGGFTAEVSGMYWGLGYESYTVTAEGKASGSADLELEFSLVDVLFHFPLESVRFALGYGMGSMDGRFKGSGASVEADSAKVSQWLVELGVPVNKSFDIHLGYRNLTVEDAELSNTGGDALQVSGSMLSVGLRGTF